MIQSSDRLEQDSLVVLQSIIYNYSLLKDYQKYQAKVLKLQEREKTPQNQAKLDAVMSFVFD